MRGIELATGYSWEIETLDALKLKPGEAMRFQLAGKGLGGSARQIISLEGLGEGETAINQTQSGAVLETDFP